MSNFIEFGNIPVVKLILITSLRGFENSFLKSLSILVGMLSDPQALSVLTVVIISSMSSF